MTEVSGRAINPESVLEYHKRASEVGLTCSDEFQKLLAILQGAEIPLRESGAFTVRILMPVSYLIYTLLLRNRSENALISLHLEVLLVNWRHACDRMRISTMTAFQKRTPNSSKRSRRQHCLAGEGPCHCRRFLMSRRLSS